MLAVRGCDLLAGPVTLPVATVVAAAAAAALVAWALVAWVRRGRRVYLLDFECFRPSDELQITKQRFIDGSRSSGVRWHC